MNSNVTVMPLITCDAVLKGVGPKDLVRAVAAFAKAEGMALKVQREPQALTPREVYLFDLQGKGLSVSGDSAVDDLVEGRQPKIYSFAIYPDLLTLSSPFDFAVLQPKAERVARDLQLSMRDVADVTIRPVPK